MAIRKIWRRLALVSTAFFWASCDDGGTEPIFNPSISENSSSATAPSSSSAEPESSSSSMSERSSSSEKVDACQDTQKYKYTVASTGLRCGPLEKIFTSRDMLSFECCDGSRIEAGDPTTGMSAESCFLPTNSETPGCLVNDSLFTPAEKEAREKAVNLAEYSKTYCKEEGGVKSFTKYCPDHYIVSSSYCSDIAKSAAKKKFEDAGYGEVGYDGNPISRCVSDLVAIPAVYGVMPASCETVPATLTCEDDSVIEIDSYKEAKISYENKKASCEAEGDEIVEKMKACYPEGTFAEEPPESSSAQD